MHTEHRLGRTRASYTADQGGKLKIPRSTLWRQHARRQREDEEDGTANRSGGHLCDEFLPDHHTDRPDSPATTLSDDCATLAVVSRPSPRFAGQNPSNVETATVPESLVKKPAASLVCLTLEEQAYLLIDLERWWKTNATKQHLQLDLRVSYSLMKRLSAERTTNYPTSIYMLRRLFEPAVSLDQSIHYVCPDHAIILGRQPIQHGTDLEYVCDFVKEETHTINAKNMQQNSILYIPLENELKELVEARYAELTAGLRLRNSATEPSVISELVEGAYYRRLRQRIAEHDITLLVHADGASLADSSDLKAYAVHCTIAELPARSRNCCGLLNTLWVGKSSHMPHRKVLLRPFLKEMRKLSTTGMSVNINGPTICFRVFAGCCSADVMERGPLVGIWSPHSLQGCTACLAKCLTWQDPKNPRSHHQVYLARLCMSADPQTDKGIFAIGERLASLPLEIREAARHDPECEGVCERSPLHSLKEFSLASGLPVEWMHPVLKGLLPKFFAACPKLSENTVMLNERAKSLDLPNVISRKLRDFSGKNWKANEWRNILFMGPYLFHDILTEEQFSVWSLLVSVTSTAVLDELTATDIQALERECIELTLKLEKLFGDGFMVYNVHQILHIPQTCRKFGSMAGHCALAFENWIGNLTRGIKGHNQITRETAITTALRKITDYLSSNIETSGIADDLHNILERLTHSVHHTKAVKCSNTVLLGDSVTYRSLAKKEPDVARAVDRFVKENPLELDFSLGHQSFYQKVIVDGYKIDGKESYADAYANGMFYSGKLFYRFLYAVILTTSSVLATRVFFICRSANALPDKVYDQPWHLPTFGVFSWSSDIVLIPSENFGGMAEEMTYDGPKCWALVCQRFCTSLTRPCCVPFLVLYLSAEKGNLYCFKSGLENTVRSDS